jgi:hypothetical protein
MTGVAMAAALKHIEKTGEIGIEIGVRIFLANNEHRPGRPDARLARTRPRKKCVQRRGVHVWAAPRAVNSEKA